MIALRAITTGRAAKRSCVVVLGMHRSGTSMTARLVSLMGAALPRTLMPENHDNPAEFWESAPLSDIHNAILATEGLSWEDWGALHEAQLDPLQRAAYVEMLRAGFHQEFQEAGFSVLKDPRICRLFSFWGEAFAQMAIRPIIVLPLRNPVEVAHSLKA